MWDFSYDKGGMGTTSVQLLSGTPNIQDMSPVETLHPELRGPKITLSLRKIRRSPGTAQVVLKGVLDETAFSTRNKELFHELGLTHSPCWTWSEGAVVDPLRSVSTKEAQLPPIASPLTEVASKRRTLSGQWSYRSHLYIALLGYHLW